MEKILPVASFPDLSLAQVTIGRGRSLPRWEATGSIYHVSFHLADSVPQTQLEIWRAERQRLTELAKTAGRPLTTEEIGLMKRAYDEHVERYLASGYGSCLLRHAEAAEATKKTICQANGDKYALHEWCVMPNHVHIIVGGFTNAAPIRDILQIWKSASAHRINRLLGRTGEVWHRDAYTRIIRDRDEYSRQMSYVWNNSESTGLKEGFLRKRYIGE